MIEMNSMLVIEGITVDTAALFSISHNCAPGVCSRDVCCCSRYEICIDNKELARIVGYIPEASKFAYELRCDAGFENIFEETDDNLYLIDSDGNDLCVFAYPDPQSNVLCSLHTVALEMDLSPGEVKPRSCIIWPLAVSESSPVTLSIADDAFGFPCNKKKDAGLLDPGIACIIKDVYGEAFLKEVEDASTII
jgi:hypothetical protein